MFHASDLKLYTAKRVMVFTSYGTFDGTVTRVGRAALTLAPASMVAEDGGRAPIDGDTVIPFGQVEWVQVP